jgi:hypothetical protein
LSKHVRSRFITLALALALTQAASTMPLVTLTLTLKDKTGQDRTEDTLHFNFFDGSLVRVKVRVRIDQGLG